MPAEAEKARAAGRACVSLFREHGAPLVIKADNDSAFTAQETQELLSRWGMFFSCRPWSSRPTKAFARPGAHEVGAGR
jgi:hypothetical protein